MNQVASAEQQRGRLFAVSPQDKLQAERGRRVSATLHDNEIDMPAVQLQDSSVTQNVVHSMLWSQERRGVGGGGSRELGTDA